MSQFVVSGATGLVPRSPTAGRSSAPDVGATTKKSGTTNAGAMMHSPFEVALQTGRLHEREDVLSYLTQLAVSTDNEIAWEAVNYIKNGSHKRTQ
jgi:hypothetical protein